ncbi:MAG: FMN-binding protein [Spirochaetaceae bacterium]|nr:MAG: FMN-binding protein [Spirochaetaceae bacterium]
MRTRSTTLLFVAAVLLALLFLPTAVMAQSIQYRDGTYYAEGDPDARGRSSLIEITVKRGRIVAVHYDEVERDSDGNVTMSKLNNYAYAESWRNARDGNVTQFTAFPAYIEQLKETGDPARVDVITGATSSHQGFVGVARQALRGARR